MRLIDADKLMESLNPKESVWVGLVLSELIANVPTVKAIPIEWIKMWCVKNYPTYPRIITEQLLKKTETWRMIEDWEKEND